jgi:hypothetical protein
MKKALTVVFCTLALLAMNTPLTAETVSGLITVTRDASRAIVSAVIETNERDNSGGPKIYNIVMDENGQAIAKQYENNEVKIEGSISGKEITADTWSRVKQSGPAYSEPEPEPEPEEEEEENEPSDVEESPEDTKEEPADEETEEE